MSNAPQTCREAALILLADHSQNISAKAASFLGSVCKSDCTGLSPRQFKWINQLLAFNDLPKLTRTITDGQESEDGNGEGPK